MRLFLTFLALCASTSASAALSPDQVRVLFAGIDYQAVWLCPEPELARDLKISFTCDAASQPKRRPTAYYSSNWKTFWTEGPRLLHFLGGRKGYGDLIFVREDGINRWQLHADESGKLLAAIQYDADGARFAVPAKDGQRILDEEEAAWAARADALK